MILSYASGIFHHKRTTREKLRTAAGSPAFPDPGNLTSKFEHRLSRFSYSSLSICSILQEVSGESVCFSRKVRQENVSILQTLRRIFAKQTY